MHYNAFFSKVMLLK